MKTNDLSNTMAITRPIEAEITFETCREYSRQLSDQIAEWLMPAMQRNGINPSLSLFADLQRQPVVFDSPSPYSNLMNVLNQFAGVVSGGYDATMRLEAARKEIDRLTRLLDQLTQE